MSATGVFWAPLEADPNDRSAWVPLGVATADWRTEAAVTEPYDWVDFRDVTGRTITLEFSITKREVRRLKKAFPRTRTELRCSTRWSEYHRRQKRRSRR